MFVKFLKERKAIVTLYAFFKGRKNAFRMDVRRTNDLILDTLTYGEGYNPIAKKWERPEIIKETKSKLVLCQLWRFYVLDHIEEIPYEEVKNMLIGQLTNNIKTNGMREDKDVENYFKKYKTLLNGK